MHPQHLYSNRAVTLIQQSVKKLLYFTDTAIHSSVVKISWFEMPQNSIFSKIFLGEHTARLPTFQPSTAYGGLRLRVQRLVPAILAVYVN